MTEEKTNVCPHCGETHTTTTRAVQLTFKGEALEAIELLATRRKETVGQFFYHLLWLESAKVPRARHLLEHAGEGDCER